MTARHCLPRPGTEPVQVFLGYSQGAFTRFVGTTASDWVTLPLRDLALLCRSGLSGGLALAPTPNEGDRVTPRGYGAPGVHVLDARRCRVLKPPVLGLLHLDCTVSNGMSGGPVMTDEGVAATLIARGETYAVAEILDRATLAAACPDAFTEAAPSRP